MHSTFIMANSQVQVTCHRAAGKPFCQRKVPVDKLCRAEQRKQQLNSMKLKQFANAVATSLTAVLLAGLVAASNPEAVVHHSDNIQLPDKVDLAEIPLFLPTSTLDNSSLAAVATYSSAATCSTCQQATVAVLMLVHQGVPHAAVWKRWEQLHNGSLVIWVHNKASSKLGPGVPGRSFIERRLLTTSVNAGWGDLFWFSAMIQSLGEIISHCSNVQQIALVTGVDLPLQIMGKHNLPPHGISYFLEFPAYEGPANWLPFLREATTLPQRYISNVEFHHTYPVMSVQAASILVHNYHKAMSLGMQLLPLFRAPKFPFTFDEIVPLTTLRYLGHSSSIRYVSTTALHFPRGYFTRHPYTWSSLDGEVNTTFYKPPMTLRRLLGIHQRVQKRSSSTYLFLRKVHVRDASQARELLQVLEQLGSKSA
jgi:hypothetical protein